MTINFNKFKLIVVSILTLVSICWFSSCRKEEKVITEEQTVTIGGKKVDKILIGPDTPNQEITLTQELTLDNGLILPIGTVISRIENDPSSLRYRLPESYLVTGVSAGGRQLASSAGTITCSCTQGNGCTPFVAMSGKNLVEGCALGKYCSSCKTTRSARQGIIIEGKDETWVEASGLDIINIKEGIHFVIDRKELDSLKCPFSFIIGAGEIQKEVFDFMDGFQKDKLEQVRSAKTIADIPVEYSLIHVSVYGRVFLMPVQRSLAENSTNPLLNELILTGPNANPRMATASCRCTSGSKGCKLVERNALIGKAIYCEAGECVTCQLKY
ncbi:hypothetical protein IC229_18155 [Spirosoma sp. BT702]|uniref:Uncharacterized protein n=1 Tax=Spirosoma profusum TaxID=2771354 RepID=A0A926XXK9_9BACT|nr:hypothetical protein [Spirosoma profusum]MBD2702577.1 hypothetical protein [Spirosoma profusum]